MPDTPLTPEQAAAMQAQLYAYYVATAAEAAAARAAFLAPLTDILASDEYATVKAAISAIDGRYDAEPFAPHLRCLKTGLVSLVVA